MRRIVLDTNCLLMCIPVKSPYRAVWNAFLAKRFTLCLSNEILEEYHEILTRKTTASIATNVISTLLNQPNIELVTPYYRFNLIQTDPDDNKFVDCCIAANAEYLVSNDSHFKVLQQIAFPKVTVLQLKHFSNIVNNYSWFNDETPQLNEDAIIYKSAKR